MNRVAVLAAQFALSYRMVRWQIEVRSHILMAVVTKLRSALLESLTCRDMGFVTIAAAKIAHLV